MNPRTIRQIIEEEEDDSAIKDEVFDAPKDVYVTIKGKLYYHPLRPKLWRGIKRLAQQRFEGSPKLFTSCWKVYKGWLAQEVNSPGCIGDVLKDLDQIASKKVNNSRSLFYMHG